MGHPRWSTTGDWSVAHTCTTAASGWLVLSCAACGLARRGGGALLTCDGTLEGPGGTFLGLGVLEYLLALTPMGTFLAGLVTLDSLDWSASLSVEGAITLYCSG